MLKTKDFRYNTRLLKAGALIDEMRTLVRLWDEKKNSMSLSVLVSQNLLGKSSRKRELDILKYAYIPRFVKGKPPQAWKIVRVLEDQNAPLEILWPVYYWITARNEPLLYDFICEELEMINKTGSVFVNVTDVIKWIKDKLEEQKIVWSEAAIKGVARKILAILRDFNILQGKVKKRIAPFYLPIEAFAYIAFCLSKEGFSASRLQEHSDWKLFLLNSSVTERMFLEADKQKLLKYLAAGRLLRIEFPAKTYEEMAHVVTQRTP